MPPRRRAPHVIAAGVVIASIGVIQVIATDVGIDAATLTQVGDDVYHLRVDHETIVAHAPLRNESGNNRIVFWRRSDPTGPDMQSCATWTEPNNGGEQEGASLRVTTTGDAGRTTAITVTKGVWMDYRSQFNVHVWDTAKPQDQRARQLAAFDLSATFGDGGSGEPFPWRLCARVVGTVVSFIAWPTSQAQPAWGDPEHGGSVELPPGAPTTGHAGFYVGHIPPGSSVPFADLAVTPVTAGPGVGVDGAGPTAPGSTAPGSNGPMSNGPR